MATAAPISQNQSINGLKLITSEDQLQRLALPIAKKVKEIPELINQATIISEYTLEPALADWYVSLRTIKRLPKSVYPLPGNIREIFNQPCPETICSEMKPDGTPYTLGEKCSLFLIPKDLGTIDEFQKHMQVVGETLYRKKDHPLKIGFWGEEVDKEHMVPAESTHWVLRENDIEEDVDTDRNECYSALTFDSSNQIDFDSLNLRDTIATIWLEKISLEYNLDKMGTRYQKTYIFTSVKRQNDYYDVYVKDFGEGLHVYGMYNPFFTFVSFIDEE